MPYSTSSIALSGIPAPLGGFGRLSEGLIDHRARRVRVMYAEKFAFLVRLGEHVDEVAGGPAGESLRRHQGAVVPLRPVDGPEGGEESFLLAIEHLVEQPLRSAV